MTLDIYVVELGILKVHLYAENDVLGQGFQYSHTTNRTDTHTQRRDRTLYQPHICG